MVAVDAAHRAALLVRAASPGRVRSAATDLLAAVLAAPDRPGQALAGGLRDARHLHSAERRLVGDGVRAVIRLRHVLGAALGPAGADRWWVGWLVVEGLPSDQAAIALGDPLDGAVARGLRSIEAARDDVAALTIAGDPVGALSFASGASVALARALLASLGDEAPDFVRASAARAPVDLRVNVARGSVMAARRALEREGIEVVPVAMAPLALRVVGRANVVGSRPFREGLVEIQDAGSQVLASLVQPRGGERVVDLCAGAGGKTLALAAEAPEAEIVATDTRGRALNELRVRARRAGAGRVRVARLDVDGGWPGAPVGQIDRVLVDAPCSGTGTLRRHPEHLLRLDATNLDDLPPLQGAILDRAAALLRPGGRLVYGTCSVLRDENDAVVQAFLARWPTFREVPLAAVLGAERAAALGGDRLRLSPHRHGTDGFFGCVLELRG